jgi:hypothetical protein
MASLSPPASNRSRQYIPKYFKSPFEDEQENIDSARTSIIDAQSISTIADDTHLTHIDANLRLPKIAVGISAAPHEMSAGEIRQPKVDTPLESSLTYRATTKSRGGEYKKSATKIQVNSFRMFFEPSILPGLVAWDELPSQESNENCDAIANNEDQRLAVRTTRHDRAITSRPHFTTGSDFKFAAPSGQITGVSGAAGAGGL